MSNYPKQLASLISMLKSGKLGEPTVIHLFQELLDSGLIWHLDAKTQEVAESLLQRGLIKRQGRRSETILDLP